MGAGAGDGPLDASNDLKAALARGEFPCIGATTLRNTRSTWKPGYSHGATFSTGRCVRELSHEDAIHIIRAISPKYEEHHEVSVEAGVIEEIVRFSGRHILERHLPDKAINILDLPVQESLGRERAWMLLMEVVESSDRHSRSKV